MERDLKARRTFYLNAETCLQLRLLSLSMRKSMSELIELMTEELWDQKKNKVTHLVNERTATKKAAEILRQAVVH